VIFLRCQGALLPGLIVSATAMIVLAMTGTFEELFISIALLSVATDAFVYSAVLRLRRTEPDLPRLYRAKGYPWLPILVLLYAVSIVSRRVGRPRIDGAWRFGIARQRPGAPVAPIEASSTLRSQRTSVVMTLLR
jgi:amino acid transporter